MRARYIHSLGIDIPRVHVCRGGGARREEEGVPAYVLDYTANTGVTRAAPSGTCCSYSRREVERKGGRGKGRERFKGNGGFRDSESRNFLTVIFFFFSFWRRRMRRRRRIVHGSTK